MKNKKFCFDDFKFWLKNKEFKNNLIELIKWVLIDIYRKIKFGKPLHLFGVYCVTALYGCGKTMSMTKIAYDYRKKYGEQVIICSNFGLKLQDFAFNNINLVIKQYDKPIIFFWDEVQNDFPSTDKNFPREVRQALSLCRKGNGKMFYWASQDHELVHKNIRRLTVGYGLCKTILNRYTKIKWFRPIDYAKYFDQTDFKKRLKIHPYKKQKFVQADYLRDLYNSYGWDNGEKLVNNAKELLKI